MALVAGIDQAVDASGTIGPWRDEFAVDFVTDTSAASQERERARARARARARRQSPAAAREADKKLPPLTTKKSGGIKIMGRHVPYIVIGGLGLGALVGLWPLLTKKKRKKNGRR